MASSLWTTGTSPGDACVRSAPFPDSLLLHLFHEPTLSTVPWSLHVGALAAVSPTARRQEAYLISKWSRQQLRPTQRQCFLEHNSCRFNVHCNPKAMQLCPRDSLSVAWSGEAGLPQHLPQLQGLSGEERSQQCVRV